MRFNGKLFCDINPTCYAISLKKEIIKRHIKNFFGREKYAKTVSKEKLPNTVSSYSSNQIKRGGGVDLTSQENKVTNIRIAAAHINGLLIRPGETFSFWKTVGKITKKKGYKNGRIIKNNKLIPGLGGGLCNLGNTIHRLVLHSPLKVTEFHKHSDALAPDGAVRIPLSSGTSVNYNNVDFRFYNNTDQTVQLLVWIENDYLYGELRSETPFANSYALIEEDHHFRKEGEKYYRFSKIYRQTTENASGTVLEKKLILDNRSEVMFDYEAIPKELIRE